MLSDLLVPATARHAAPDPGVLSSHDGPITVAVGEAVNTALRAGALVANVVGRGIAVISAVEPEAVYLWNVTEGPLPVSADEERTFARWAFLERQMRHAAAPGAHWPVNVFRGGVARTIAHAARDLHSPYIVMGLGRHRPQDRFLGGETALRAIRHADCAVLAVTDAFTALPSTMVAGVDFSDASAHAVRQAVPLLAPAGTLHLVHVWQSDRMANEGEPRSTEPCVAMTEQLARFVDALDLPSHLTVHRATPEGAPAERLLAYAAEVHAGMIVVGRHGRSVLDRLVVGSIASRVLRGAESAVLVVPDPPPSARLKLAEHRGATRSGVPREDWAPYLERFSRQFAGRMVSLDIYDPEHSLHSQERGSVLFGASFDPATGHLEVILGELNGRRRHLTRVIPDARRMSALVSPSGAVYGLHVTHGTGETLLVVFPMPRD